MSISSGSGVAVPRGAVEAGAGEGDAPGVGFAA